MLTVTWHSTGVTFYNGCSLYVLLNTSWIHQGLVQERRNSSALAMELRLSCKNPSTSWHSYIFHIIGPLSPSVRVINCYWWIPLSQRPINVEFWFSLLLAWTSQAFNKQSCWWHQMSYCSCDVTVMFWEPHLPLSSVAISETLISFLSYILQSNSCCLRAIAGTTIPSHPCQATATHLKMGYP